MAVYFTRAKQQKNYRSLESGFDLLYCFFSSCFHWSSPTTSTIAHECDGALVLVPLVPQCGVGDDDRSEVVRVSAIFFCPSVDLLRNSIRSTLLPPDYDGVVTLSSAPLLPSIAFPWLPINLAVSFTSSQSKKELPIIAWNLALILCFLFLISSETNATKNRRSIPPECASNMNGTGRFWIPTRTTQCCPIRELCDLELHEVFWLSPIFQNRFRA